jgi:TonB family protein
MLKKNNSSRWAHGWMNPALIAGVLAVSLLSAKPIHAQTREPNAPERKIVTRVEPEYPDTLKRLYIGGVVRVEVVIGSNGTVQNTALLGGNPILGQSAMKAIKQWKYMAASAKEKLVVQLEFDPHR